MRADRLVAALLLLQTRGRMTAAELAGELEVSVATARRDLVALSTAGIPVYPQPGRGGGWSLVGGARIDLTGLTAAEARALFLIGGTAEAADPAVRSALRKLVRALPGPFREQARAAAEAVVVDAAPWGARSAERPPLIGLLQEAVVRRRKVALVYTDQTGNRTERSVDPWGLVDKAEVWYLVAGTSQGRRTFRLDRMTEVTLTQTPAERPPEFDLARTWEQIVDDVEQERSLVTATLVVQERHLPVLRTQHGRHFHHEGPLPHGRAQVRLAAPNAVMLAQHLAGWGDLVEVLGPESVRAELSRLGSELIARYGPAGGGTQCRGKPRSL